MRLFDWIEGRPATNGQRISELEDKVIELRFALEDAYRIIDVMLNEFNIEVTNEMLLKDINFREWVRYRLIRSMVKEEMNNE